jgi:trans-2,3-dihydro-3-hydroxyanthranilate isomerase
MDFLQIDVFADKPFSGNPLAVFPNAGELTTTQMQSIALEMNLSETSFVTEWDSESYSVRIFTPREELPFAGHPTIGTAWTMMHLSRVKGPRVTQHSKAGPTLVVAEGNELWFQRTGEAGSDRLTSDESVNQKLAQALGLDEEEIGLDARELGRHGRLEAAPADCGVEMLMVPVRDQKALTRIQVNVPALNESVPTGAYCFTAVKPGSLRARGFFPVMGNVEDPATGSAAANLGLYLADRIGPLDLDIVQGVEMGRPSRLFVKAAEGDVRVGGHCEPVFKGHLDKLP